MLRLCWSRFPASVTFSLSAAKFFSAFRTWSNDANPKFRFSLREIYFVQGDKITYAFSNSELLFFLSFFGLFFPVGCLGLALRFTVDLILAGENFLVLSFDFEVSLGF